MHWGLCYKKWALSLENRKLVSWALSLPTCSLLQSRTLSSSYYQPPWHYGELTWKLTSKVKSLSPDGDTHSIFQGCLLYYILWKVVSAFTHKDVQRYNRLTGNGLPTLIFWKPWLRMIAVFHVLWNIIQITYLLWVKNNGFTKTRIRKMIAYVARFVGLGI